MKLTVRLKVVAKHEDELHCTILLKPEHIRDDDEEPAHLIVPRDDFKNANVGDVFELVHQTTAPPEQGIVRRCCQTRGDEPHKATCVSRM